MNKEEYMNELTQALKQFDTETRKEIIEDYEEHFAEAKTQGIDEETVIRELGSIDELIEGLKETVTVKENTAVTTERENREQEEYFGFDGEHYIEGAVISGNTVEIVAAVSSDDMFHLYYQEPDEDMELYQEERDGILYAGVKGGNGKSFVKGILDKLLNSFFGNGKAASTQEEDGASPKTSKNALAPLDNMDFGPGQKIIVLVPAGMKTVTLNSATGNINISGINCETLTVNTATATVKATEIECRDMLVKDVSGYVEVNKTLAETLKIKNVSGSIKTEFISGQRCEQDTVSGSVNSELSFSDFSIKTTSGLINATVHNEIKEARLSSVSGACMLKLTDEVNLTAHVSTVSGGTNLNVGEAHVNAKGNHVFGTGKAQVYMNTVSGSIKIN